MSRAASNRSLLLPYVLPYIAYVLPGAFDAQLGRSGVYLLRLAIVPLALAWGWRHYAAILGPRNRFASAALGAVVGALGCALWVALALPLAPAGAPAWGDSEWALRALGSSLLPPVFEELLFRGWLLAVVLQWSRARSLSAALDDTSLHRLEPGSCSAVAVAVSTLLFALGHAPFEWAAALVYGALMCGLWITRRDLLSCMVAHATTNACLALWIRTAGLWSLW